MQYDSTYGGILSQNSLLHANNEFGLGWYSDHHFQYGYLLYGMAVLVKLDDIFYRTYKANMDVFVRDICNPFHDDDMFPFVRHKDMYDGHSWASGLFTQGNGKGQESSSEVGMLVLVHM